MRSKQFTCLPEQPFVGAFSTDQSAVDWAPVLVAGGGECLAESYVN